ncbi:Uncharacterised protein [Mycobacteroides abscessus subsp. abscessus]|nr:Uncharacterised protein [Mycobacteroides abscessus subsp. abscessus]
MVFDDAGVAVLAGSALGVAFAGVEFLVAVLVSAVAFGAFVAVSLWADFFCAELLSAELLCAAAGSVDDFAVIFGAACSVVTWAVRVTVGSVSGLSMGVPGSISVSSSSSKRAHSGCSSGLSKRRSSASSPLMASSAICCCARIPACSV